MLVLAGKSMHIERQIILLPQTPGRLSATAALVGSARVKAFDSLLLALQSCAH